MKTWWHRHEFEWWIGFVIMFPAIFVLCGAVFGLAVALEALLA